MNTEQPDATISINTAAIEPLFKPWEEPNKHRVRAKTGQAPKIINRRRDSPIALIKKLRADVKEWRDLNYYGASDTTRTLLSYWFERSHRATDNNGEEIDFQYYFCQREAIETLIFLMEIKSIKSLASLFSSYVNETETLGVNPEDDLWARYAFKLATGAGKTKCMSLAIVWSYFHALRESNSEMAKHFVIIAPNLTVFERLKEDFHPEGGGADIFVKDPLIPPEWEGDWNFSVILQNEVSGATAGGVLYLTNIHRLFESSKERKTQTDTYDWAGPAVSVPKTGAELRERITSHKRIMILNDEAHHVWDPGSAWNNAIRWLHEEVQKRSGNGLLAQLDFSATPKDNKGQMFQHVICDTPLGEAVDAGIVKTPIIGRIGDLKEQAHEDASYRFEMHLRLGYERWLRSSEEWSKSGRKPLLFVMCEDTKSADQIAKRLNGDPVFSQLNNKTINLHTNLKGKVKKRKISGRTIEVFEESEKEISDEDLKAIRRISRELDSHHSQYLCIVSVLMLREGWDVRNVTTIVPLRPYSSKSNILPEQTLGRGLRRMTPPGETNELVTVVEHPAFTDLYTKELEQEGLHIGIVDSKDVPKTTVTIYPDNSKDFATLDIVLPFLTTAHGIRPKLEDITIGEVKKAFQKYEALPLGSVGPTELKYKGHHLITGELVEQMKLYQPLLENGITAISYFVRELEKICKVQSTHQILAPLLQTFMEEILFDEKVSPTDQRLTNRLSDKDVHEHIRAIFVPLIRSRTVETKKRRIQGESILLRNWRAYQVTSSERHTVQQADGTLFNLVPCDQSLEVAMTSFLDRAPDVVAFAKNAGPQALRIDYLTREQRPAFYKPDFFVRREDGSYALVETKGQEDLNVPRKAVAAVEWCKIASKNADNNWQYVFIPQSVMENLTGSRFDALVRASAPALKNLQNEPTKTPDLPFFTPRPESDVEEFYSKEIFKKLPSRGKKMAKDAFELYHFLEQKKETTNFAPVFTTLLGLMDEACKSMILKCLEDKVPSNPGERDEWLNPNLENIDRNRQQHYKNAEQNLKRGLIYSNPHSVIGLLCFCLDHALNDKTKPDGVFKTVRESFRWPGARKLLERVSEINKFRNTYVAHSNKELTNKTLAKNNLKKWIETIGLIST